MNDSKYIAIADDHTMVRKGLSALISLFPGYKVMLEAGNGTELMAQLERAPSVPDILLLDIAMPTMDGYSTAEWVTAHHPSIRILALSTMESEFAIIRMIRAGARGYLHKDAEPGELKQAFHDVISLGYYYNTYIDRQKLRMASSSSCPDEPGGLVRITDRERAFLQLACSEKTYYEIGKEMIVSERTVDGYRDSLFKKLKVTTRVGLALYAVRNGLVHL
ncbi:MAG TPA: response regulator transcription factor [Puia sp.]